MNRYQQPTCKSGVAVWTHDSQIHLLAAASDKAPSHQVVLTTPVKL